ncbi:MAG: TadE/TadG family type IV pilus assembly protein [Mesorhizobium sp.]|jgi:Flp pilus assembly protein TadG
MLVGAGAHRKIANFCSGAVRFCKDRRGVAAIEFAFIAPVLLAMYFVTMEVSQGIETSKKVSRISSMAADLVTQRSSVTEGDLRAIMDIGASTLQPYNRSVPKIIITEISISNETTPTATVVWSRKIDGGVFAIGEAAKNTTTVPDSLKIPGTSLIRVETDLIYKPMITWAADRKQAMGLSAAFDSISMSETYYLRARMSPSIDCSDCNGK